MKVDQGAGDGKAKARGKAKTHGKHGTEGKKLGHDKGKKTRRPGRR